MLGIRGVALWWHVMTVVLVATMVMMMVETLSLTNHANTNTVALLNPNGTRTTWWTRGSNGPWQPPKHTWGPNGRLPLKVRITTKIKNQKPLQHPPHLVDEATTSWTGPGSIPTCGVSVVNSNRAHNQIGWFPRRGPKKSVKVWPWSVGLVTVTTVFRGNPNTNDFFIYFKRDGVTISPFHDIPLYADEGNKIFNMVVEVPRWTNSKMEIATKEPLNPIKQDVKKGKLRYVANVFPHHGYIWNYGAIPQTWEDPLHMDESTGCKGDNDPIDVCEIGYRVANRGDVLQVKVLGTVALIDEGETDWKLIVIDVNDPLAPELNDIGDVEKHMPGFLKATVEWFRIYKIPDGKPENQFAFNGEVKDREFAHKVIMETHESWQRLVQGVSENGGINTSCITIPNAVSKLTSAEAEEVLKASPEPGPAQPLDPKIDLWHYVSLK